MFEVGARFRETDRTVGDFDAIHVSRHNIRLSKDRINKVTPIAAACFRFC